MSYARKDKYDKAIELFRDINEESDSNLRRFVYWALAKCYEKKEDYENSNNYYSQSQIIDYHLQTSSLIFWINWGYCQRLNKKYERSLDYFQKALAIAKELKKLQDYQLKKKLPDLKNIAIEV